MMTHSSNPIVQRALDAAQGRETNRELHSSKPIVQQALEWVKAHPLPHPSKDHVRRTQTFCRRLQRKIDELREAEKNGGAK